MVQPSHAITENARQAERVRNYRHEKQKEFQELYEQMVDDTSKFIRAERSALMEENLRAEIRNWINTYFEQTGKIPELPSAESGGSRIILSRQVRATMRIGKRAGQNGPVFRATDDFF